jgi:inosine-uridine nucleoside N-ribohydrolase
MFVLVHDCDPGIDDAFALATLVGLGLVPDAVVAVAGNAGADATAANAAGLVAHLGIDSVVARGAARAVHGAFPAGEPRVHGVDGLGGGAGLLRAPDRPVLDDGIGLLSGTVVATGALTDVALAVRRGQSIDRVVWMGGSVAIGGNVTAAAEFNAFCDPEAADEVLVSGLPVDVVPLDVTTLVPLTEADLSRIEALGPVAAPFARAGRFMLDALATGACAYVHDAVAVVALSRPDLFVWERRTVRCETGGRHARGATIVDRRSQGEGPVRVAMGLDAGPVHDLVIDAVVAALSGAVGGT